MTKLNTIIGILALVGVAVKNRTIDKELIFHSDRGIQYACTAFTNILKTNKGEVKQSMSRKGDCWDNAVAKSFFKSLKVEWVYTQKYNNKAEARISIFQYIETWYNRKRRYSAIGYKTIEEYEQLFINQKLAA